MGIVCMMSTYGRELPVGLAEDTGGVHEDDNFSVCGFVSAVSSAGEVCGKGQTSWTDGRRYIHTSTSVGRFSPRVVYGRCFLSPALRIANEQQSIAGDNNESPLKEGVPC